MTFVFNKKRGKRNLSLLGSAELGVHPCGGVGRGWGGWKLPLKDGACRLQSGLVVKVRAAVLSQTSESSRTTLLTHLKHTQFPPRASGPEPPPGCNWGQWSLPSRDSRVQPENSFSTLSFPVCEVTCRGLGVHSAIESLQAARNPEFDRNCSACWSRHHRPGRSERLRTRKGLSGTDLEKGC